MSEKTILNKFQLLASKLGHRLWRNNSGSAWQGQAERLKNGDVLIKNPRLINFSLALGSSDLIGGTQVVVTPEMVGHKIFVFTAIEIKCKATKTTDEQLAFRDMVVSLGGIATIERFKSEDIEGNQYEQIANQFQGIKPTP